MPSSDPRQSGSRGEVWPPLRETPSVSPVDGSVLGWYPTVAPEAVSERAVRLRAEGASSADRPIRERLQAVRCLRESLAARAESLAEVLAREIGRPVVEGYGAEILPTLRSLAWLERNAERVLAPQVLARFPARRVQEWEPYGVIGLISPWNYPLFLTLPVIAAALAAGNAVVWKPSDLALAASAEIAAILREAGLERLVAVVPGDGAVGEAVAEAPCDKYVLIGSAETGRRVLERLGRGLKPAVAELSGNDPMLVLRDADLETAASAAVWARVTGAGQTCMAPRRLYVERAVYGPFLELLRARLAGLSIGDPRDARTEVGPVRTETLRDAATDAVDDALARDARLVRGGRELPGPGFYVDPALLMDCDESMTVFQGDLFAPVLATAPVERAEEAVERANSSPYALTASVWTRDRNSGLALARRLHGGVVSVNDVILPSADGRVPFGGSGESGYGRTRGAAGLLEMVRPRVLDGGPPAALPRQHLYPYREGTLEVLKAAAEIEGARGAGRLSGVARMLRAVRGYGAESERREG